MTTIAPGGYRSPGRRGSRAGFECGAAASMIGADAVVSVDVAHDPGYDVAPLVLQLGSPLHQPRPVQTLRTRYALLADTLGLPRERLVAWSIARVVESALWYASRTTSLPGPRR